MKVNKMLMFFLLVAILLSGILPTANIVYARVTEEQIRGELSQVFLNDGGRAFQTMLCDVKKIKQGARCRVICGGWGPFR